MEIFKNRNIFILIRNKNIWLILLILICTSCSGKASVTLWKKDIDFSKYKKAYLTVCNPSGNNLDDRISEYGMLDDYLVRQMGFEIPQRTGILIERIDDWKSYIESIKDKKNSLYIRCDFEYGLSIPPMPRREFDGLIWRHRTETIIRLMDLQSQEDLATLKYERRYFDGKIPEEVLYELLIKAIRDNKDYLESN